MVFQFSSEYGISTVKYEFTFSHLKPSVVQVWVCSYKVIWASVTWDGSIQKYSLWARLFPWGISLLPKARKDQFLMGQQDEENPALRSSSKSW